MSLQKYSGLGAFAFAGLVPIALAAIGLAACSGGSSNDDLPLIRATLSIKTVSQGGICESVPVRISPKELMGQANKYANNKMMVTEVNTTGPTDEHGAPMCNGTGETLPMAPGKWEFSAPLASGSATCIRDVESAGDLSILLIDGVDGCSGAPVEAPADSAAPAEGEAPAAPADPAAPAAG